MEHNPHTRRGETQEVAHKTKNNTYRLGVSPTEVASKNENVQRNARKLSGLHPTYKGSSARSVTPQGWYAGYSGRIGFTLIELLVVVLIIGILAAVALPQYQKAVKKAQGREVLVALDALDKAVHAYILETGHVLCRNPHVMGCHIPNASDLSMEMPILKYFQYAPACSDAPRSENFQRFDENCGGVSFYANKAEAVVTAKWDMYTGIRTPGTTLCKGVNCKDYFDCVSEESGEKCISNGAPDKEHCAGGDAAWQSYSYCYLD